MDTLFSPYLWRPSKDKLPELSRAEMLRYLGHSHQAIGDELAGRIEAAAALATEDARPVGVYRIFRSAAACNDDEEPCIRLLGTTIELQGRDIYRHLKDASRCAVLCCTLGMQTERRMRELAARDPLDATLYDAACSALVEGAVDMLDESVQQRAASHGFKTNWRFSCGYGDCPLEAQPSLLAALNAGRLCGVSATPGCLLLPSKSVTAMIGLFEGEVRDANSRPNCSICRLRTSCAFRARQTTCHR